MKALGLLLFTVVFVHGAGAKDPEVNWSPKPATMTLSIGGAFGQSYEITYDRRELRYYEAKNFFLIRETKPKVIKPSEQEWKDFYMELDRIKAWRWKRHYQDPEMNDGTYWQAFIVYELREPRDVISSGSNAYPPNFQEFLAAVQRLIGGKAFR